MEERGEWGCVGGFFRLFLLIGLAYGLYLWITPAAPPEHSALVSADERTYLEFENEWHSGGLDGDAYWTMNVYYTRLGGWFGRTKRVLVEQDPSGSEATNLDDIQLTRSSEAATASSIYVFGKWFIPPAHFPDDSVKYMGWPSR